MHLLLVNNSISRLAVYHPLKVNSKNILSCRLRLKFDSFESCRLPHWEALKWLYLRFKVTSSYCIGHPYFYRYFEKLHDLKKITVKVKKTHMTSFICRKSSERRIVSKIINRGRGCIPVYVYNIFSPCLMKTLQNVIQPILKGKSHGYFLHILSRSKLLTNKFLSGY